MIRDQETLNLLLDTARRFVRERCVPAEQVAAGTDAIPADIVAEMRRMGLFSFAMPQEYGGMGLTLEEEALVNFESSQCSPVFRSIAGTNNGIGSMGIVIDGSWHQGCVRRICLHCRSQLPRACAQSDRQEDGSARWTSSSA